MGTTFHGYPYPEPSDPVANGDTVIRALAEKVETQLGATARGIATIQLTSDATAFVDVVFPAGRFQMTPGVVATCSDSRYFCTVQTRTANGCRITIRQYQASANSGYVEICWLAFE